MSFDPRNSSTYNIGKFGISTWTVVVTITDPRLLKALGTRTVDSEILSTIRVKDGKLGVKLLSVVFPVKVVKGDKNTVTIVDVDTFDRDVDSWQTGTASLLGLTKAGQAPKEPVKPGLEGLLTQIGRRQVKPASEQPALAAAFNKPKASKPTATKSRGKGLANPDIRRKALMAQLAKLG